MKKHALVILASWASIAQASEQTTVEKATALSQKVQNLSQGSDDDRYCFGTSHRYEKRQTWYALLDAEGNSIPTSQDTRCQYCVGSGIVATEKVQKNSSPILDSRDVCRDSSHNHGDLRAYHFDGHACCDSGKDPVNYALRKDGIKLSLKVAKLSSVYLFLHPDFIKSNATAGVGQFMVPTQTGYKVVLEWDGVRPSHQYFKIERASIGEKTQSNEPLSLGNPHAIVINNGASIMYDERAEIAARRTGSDTSFKFVSLSKQEREDLGTPEGYNETNILRFRIQKYVNVTRRDQPAQTYYDSFYRVNVPHGMVAKGGTTRGGGESLSGGMTVSGGQYTRNINTTTTTDKFEKVGEPIDFVVQLVNTESDELKYVANIRDQMTGPLAKVAQFKAAQANLDRLRLQLAETERQFDIAASAVVSSFQEPTIAKYLASLEPAVVQAVESPDTKLLNLE